MEQDNSLVEIAREETFEPFLTCQADFDAFVWGKPPSRANTFSESLRNCEEDSFVFKTFKNEFETDNLFGRSTIEKIKKGQLKITDLAADSEQKSHNPAFDLQFFLPVNSSISRNDMHECFKCYLDICSNKKLSGEKLETYNKFKSKIEEEQVNFLSLARDYWTRNQFNEKPSFIKPEVMNYTTKLWKDRLQRLHWYPKYYLKIADVPLIDDIERRASVCNFSKNLKSIGHSSLTYEPSLKHDMNIYHNLRGLESPKETNLTEFSYKPVHSALLNKGYHPEVSRDELAESLSFKNDAHIVMSSSAFLCFFDVHKDSFNPSWDLPIVIKKLPGSQKKVVFIDKALPPKQFSAAQRNKWFSKKIVLDILQDLNPENSRKNLQFCDDKRTIYLDTRSNSNSISYDDATGYDITKLETFGIQSSCDSGRTRRKRKKGSLSSSLDEQYALSSGLSYVSSDDCELSDVSRRRLSSSSHERKKPESSFMDEDIDSPPDTEDELVIDIAEDKNLTLSNEETFKANSELVGSKKEPELGSKLTTNSLLSPCKKETASKDSTSELYNLQENQKRINKTLAKAEYNTFEFKSETTSVLLKSYLKNLNVIIRTKCATKTKNRGIYINRVISTKLEYQPQWGAEVLSLSEITRDWARVFIRPESILLRVRLDPITGNVIMYERKKLQELTADFKRLYGINPYDRLTSVHMILHQLTSHPPGKYLLSHNSSGMFATLYKEEDRNHNFNMMLDYIGIDPGNVALTHHNYLVIDKMVITPMQLATRRIPALFHPKNSKFSSRLQKLKDKEMSPEKEAEKEAEKEKTLNKQKKSKKLKKKQKKKKQIPMK